ncbi:signal peptidase I [Pontivivens ytuae]|uniref:Signal peptidase I n=1 Tax=Pontivivens ytuae TaxID=2789856 RepID=A0A7S9QDR1_9RHOB|nr:signal peptidase I [Pontivivens ytuae]QPH54426.1 signal peptidase I [Pontivivens ytuae]
MADNKADGGFFETIKTIVYALLLAGLIRTLLFQPFYIPSGSMKPTLLVGDFLFVNKFAYGYAAVSCPTAAMCPFEGRLFASDPDRGDIVVFRHPVNGTDYIKRLVGLPGDSLQMVDGRLVVNGEMLPLAPAGQFEEIFERQQNTRPRCSNGAVALGATCLKEQFIETLPGGQDHFVLNIADTAADDAGVYRVPDDHFFFMGDNRDNSIDSRYFTTQQFERFRPQISGTALRDPSGVAFVHRDLLIGKANLVVLSAAGPSLFLPWNWRADRFFEWVE